MKPYSFPFSNEWDYDVVVSFCSADSFDFVEKLSGALLKLGIQTYVEDKRFRTRTKPVVLKSRMVITVSSADSLYSSLLGNLDILVQNIALVLPMWLLSVKSQKLISLKVAIEKPHFWHSKEWSSEDELVNQINQEAIRILLRGPSHTGDRPLGLLSRTEEAISLLDLGSSDEVNIVGIYGVRGIGKSLIARGIFNLIANQFEGSCFLADVRENSNKHGLVHLQETLLSEILKNDIKLGMVDKGISMLQTSLTQKKTLLILDDVDKLRQLQSIAGKLEWFGPGSRIIITTKYKG